MVKYRLNAKHKTTRTPEHQITHAVQIHLMTVAISYIRQIVTPYQIAVIESLVQTSTIRPSKLPLSLKQLQRIVGNFGYNCTTEDYFSGM